MYNLNWHLKEISQKNLATDSRHQSISDQKRMNQILFYNVGDSVEDQILPYESFYLQFHSYNSKYIKFNLTINKNSHVGIYIDKNTPPTFTKFKYFETFDGNTLISKTTVLTRHDQYIYSFQLNWKLIETFVLEIRRHQQKHTCKCSATVFIYGKHRVCSLSRWRPLVHKFAKRQQESTQVSSQNWILWECGL